MRDVQMLNCHLFILIVSKEDNLNVYHTSYEVFRNLFNEKQFS